jgi:hypothetical protein
MRQSGTNGPLTVGSLGFPVKAPGSAGLAPRRPIGVPSLPRHPLPSAAGALLGALLAGLPATGALAQAAPVPGLRGSLAQDGLTQPASPSDPYREYVENEFKLGLRIRR